MAGEAGRLIVATGSVRARPDTFDAMLRLARDITELAAEPPILEIYEANEL